MLLYHIDKTGGTVDPAIATLKEPIFDLALDSNNHLWATTGGGPLLKLDSQTGKIVKQYGDGITQALAIQPGMQRVVLAKGGSSGELIKSHTQS